MPISISAAQNKALKAGGFASETEDEGQFLTVSNVLEQYAVEFELNLEKAMKEAGNIASGALLKSVDFQLDNDGKTLRLYLADYFDYTNVGVKGVKSSRNAPSSPYQYKTLGMNEEGRRSIKSYIESGKAKVSIVRKEFAKGSEKKKISLIDAKVNTLVYMIKKYGIKATHYFDKAIEMTFKDLEQKLGEAAVADITYSINRLNTK